MSRSATQGASSAWQRARSHRQPHKRTENIDIARVGRSFVAVALIAFGIEHVIWTYFTGLALIVGGTGLLLRKTLPPAALLSGIMIFIWVIVLHIPRAVTSAGDGNEWIAVFEALAMSGIAFVLAGAGPRGPTQSILPEGTAAQRGRPGAE